MSGRENIVGVGDDVLVYGYDQYGDYWGGVLGTIECFLDGARVQVKMEKQRDKPIKMVVVDRRQCRKDKAGFYKKALKMPILSQ